MENKQDFKLACDTLHIFNRKSMIFTTPKTKVGEQVIEYIPYGNRRKYIIKKHPKSQKIIFVDKKKEMIDDNSY